MTGAEINANPSMVNLEKKHSYYSNASFENKISFILVNE